MLPIFSHKFPKKSHRICENNIRFQTKPLSELHEVRDETAIHDCAVWNPIVHIDSL